MNKKNRFRRNEHGQSLVEFALILPILMLLILGMIEFGWILNGQITLTSAAREGARTAVVCDTEGDAIIKANAAVISSTAGSSLTEVNPTTSFGANIATVNVTAKVKSIVGLFSDFDLKAKAEMRIE